ncbi:MAG TPA: FAD-binding oxidoreductase [Planctomycetes bacterium]|nr:FAD-binding oxidoreductase [Planctomycetota bacterium]
MSERIRTRPAREPRQPALLEADDEVATYLTDASRYPGGSAPRVYLPTSEGEVAWVLQHEERVLPVGAQSSLTGGAAPQGDAVLATSRMDHILSVEAGRARVQPGVALVTLQEALRERGAYFPPAPTYEGAFVGGAVSTNAAGAATWKYGTTREWVEALTVVLANGEVLEVRRGEVSAGPAGFVVETQDGSELRVPLPSYEMPDVPKRSAGYHASPGMDLVDLFVGSEGTLGVVTEIELKTLEPAPELLSVLIPCPSEAVGLQLVARLRAASQATWQGGDPCGLDVRSVESMDRRAVELVKEDGSDEAAGLSLPLDTALLLLVMLEMRADFDAAEALSDYDEDAPDSPVKRLLDLLAELDLLDESELALPSERARQEQLFAIREAVPTAVNHRVRDAQREIDGRIHKVGGDMIVPFDRFAEAMAVYRREFVEERGLDLVVWGHISDGNVHPNVVPTSHHDVEAGHDALLACGRALAAMGGCPLSEHGTGRNPVKQQLLRQLYGEEGLAQMRALKRALDPSGKLARGVVFPWEANP